MPVVLPFVALLLLMILRRNQEPLWRRAILSAAVVWGVLVTLITEGLSLFQALTRGWITAAWCLVIVALAYWYWSRAFTGISSLLDFVRRTPRVTRRPQGGQPPLSLPSGLMLAGVGLIVATTGFIALVAPPNTWDSLVYHMARVMHWIQNGSVAHFPSHNTEQLQRGPWAEFAILHLQLLSRGDRFANLVQWLSMVGSLVGVSLIAKQFGADARTQVLAVVVAATIPMGILQASSTQTDYVNAFWLVCFVWLILPLLARESPQDLRSAVVLGGAALGLAILTKPTAYFYAPPFLLWLAIHSLKADARRGLSRLLVMAGIAVALNAGHYWRNFDVYGTPLGPVGQEGCQTCKLTIDEWTAPLLASNLTRNLAIHLGTPVEALNVAVERRIVDLHALLDVSVTDPRTNWVGFPFQVRPPLYDEDMDGNVLHLLLIAGSLVALLIRRSRLPASLGLYSCALLTGFILLCCGLKWNPFLSRLHLAFFLLWAPIAGIVLSRARSTLLASLVAMLFLASSVPYLVFHSQRPLIVTPHPYPRIQLNPYREDKPSILAADRVSLYFIELPKLKAPFLEAVQILKEHRCFRLWLLKNWNDWEYPLWPLLQEGTGEAVRIEHTFVRNSSAVLADREPFASFIPCALVQPIVEPGGGRVVLKLLRDPG